MHVAAWIAATRKERSRSFWEWMGKRGLAPFSPLFRCLTPFADRGDPRLRHSLQASGAAHWMGGGSRGARRSLDRCHPQERPLAHLLVIKYLKRKFCRRQSQCQ